MQDFSGMTVMITGAAAGIGRCLAAQYAGAGAAVLLVDKEEAALQDLGRELRSEGAHVEILPCELSEAAQIQELFARVRVGGQAPDILINNAGLSRNRPVLELTAEEWDYVLNTNLRAQFLCSQQVARMLRERGRRGSIVNVSSTRALMSEANTEAYSASKGGILALTHAMAVSLSADRIRVNAVSPGWIETGDYTALLPEDHAQHPAGRVGRPEDIAAACFYLTDPANDFVTGINLVVDGGMTRRMIYAE